MRAWTKINYRIWESRMTLALPQLPQQLCFCSWGGSKGETQCQLKATYLSLVLHQTKPLLITEAFCMEQTGTLAGKLLAWPLCKKESLKKKKVGGKKKKEKNFFLVHRADGPGNGFSPFTSPRSSFFCQFGFLWQLEPCLFLTVQGGGGVADVLVLLAWLRYHLPQQ